MATQSILQLDIQRPEPLVWISRLLIVDSTEPLEVVQSISLHRGLNVVWSTDTDRGDGEAPVMTGHGAGKTTFCRLLLLLPRRALIRAKTIGSTYPE